MNRRRKWEVGAALLALLLVSACNQLNLQMGFDPRPDPSLQELSQQQPITDALSAQGPTREGHFRDLVSGDLDGDGFPELISADILTGEIVIWRGRHRLGWNPPVSLATQAEVRKIDIADLDGDARLDIIASVRGKGKNGIQVWKNVGGLRFRRMPGPGQGQTYADLFAVDLNFDGRADIIAVKEDAGAKGGLRIWENLGTGKWQPAPAPKSEGSFHGVVVADLNQDGLLDIIAAGEGPTGGVRVWLGKGKDLRWGEPNLLAKGDFWSVTVGDFNNDDIPDLLATGRDTGIRVWQGLGKGRLNRMASPISAGSFWRAVGIDRDGDGKIDIVANTMDGKGLRFWKQEERLGWVAQRLLPETGMYRTLLVADFDKDGRPDLGTATHGRGIAIWPGFGKAIKITLGPDGKRLKHNLPLIPGTRLPDLETASAPRPEAKPVPGAQPEKRLPGEYVIGSGDVLQIAIWQGLKPENIQVQVSERGLISIGYIDDVTAAGLTLKELDDVITTQLAKFIKNPRIDVTVSRFGSRVVRVMGLVNRPQTYNVSATITLLDAILLAGGHITATTDRPGGDLARVTLQRKGQTQKVNLLRYISGGADESENPILQDGDLVFVPESSPELVEQQRVYVFGQAKNPGVYPFTFNMRALDAVAKAGGFNEWAVKDEVRIIRGDPERPQVILADLKAMLQRGDRRGNHILKPNDVVYIPRTIIGDLNEFVKQVTPILNFLFFPARFREFYALNTNVLKFDVGGPSASEAEAKSGGTFTSGASTTTILQ